MRSDADAVTVYGGRTSSLSSESGTKGVTTDKPCALEACVCDKATVLRERPTREDAGCVQPQCGPKVGARGSLAKLDHWDGGRDAQARCLLSGSRVWRAM